MTTKPDYYRTPLRSREAIVEWIIQNTKQRMYDHRPHPFCFNVKCYRVNLDFEHLLGIYRNMEGDPPFTHFAEWLEPVKARYEEVKDDLFTWGVEDARRLFTDSDGFNSLWDGTNVKAEYSFEGRNGGWLSLNNFDGEDFTTRDGGYDDLRECLNGQDYAWLRRLYQLIVMLKHAVSKAQEEVETQAAFNFFANACAGISQPDTTQRLLPFMEEAV